MNLLQEFPVSELGDTALIAKSTQQMRKYGGRKMIKRKGIRATTVVGQTFVAHERRKLSSREKRTLFSTVIGHLPEKVVAESADCSPQAVRLWKAEERTVSSDSLLDLAYDYDSVWKYICVAAGRAEALRRTDYEFHSQQAEIEVLKAQVRQLMGGQ